MAIRNGESAGTAFPGRGPGGSRPENRSPGRGPSSPDVVAQRATNRLIGGPVLRMQPSIPVVRRLPVGMAPVDHTAPLKRSVVRYLCLTRAAGFSTASVDGCKRPFAPLCRFDPCNTDLTGMGISSSVERTYRTHQRWNPDLSVLSCARYVQGKRPIVVPVFGWRTAFSAFPGCPLWLVWGSQIELVILDFRCR